jgi:outer membrane protein assembly factor BamB
MPPETLADHLRKTTRNFTAPLPEEALFGLGAALARELAAAHAATPPRHPDLEPTAIGWADGKPALGEGRPSGDAAEDLLQLGALLHGLATASTPHPSWRLDGPPTAELATLERRAALAGLTSPRTEGRFRTAAEAAEALDAAGRAPSVEPVPWPAFRGGPERAGARAHSSAVSRAALRWQAAIGPVVSSPVLTARLVIAATADGLLHFLDRQTGRRVHVQRVGSAVESSPAADSGRLHVGTDDGELVTVDLAAGRETARVSVGRVVRSSPLPAGERVLVGTVDGKEGGLVAVDPAKRKIAWTRKLKAVFSSPAAAGARALVGSDDGSVHALECDKGTVAWSHKLGGRVRATPAVAGGLAVVGDFEGRLAALRVETGERAWLRELGQPVYSSAALAAGLAVVGCHDGNVHGTVLATGEPAFTFGTRGPVVGSPVAVGERFAVASTDGSLYLLDRDGQLLAEVPLSTEGLQSSPAVDGTLLCVGSARGLHALDLS